MAEGGFAVPIGGPLHGAGLVVGGIVDAFGEGPPHAWDDDRSVIQLLGLRITVEQFKSLSTSEKQTLTRAAKAAYLRGLISEMERKNVPRNGPRGAQQMLGARADLVEAYKLYEKGTTPPAPDLSAVAAIVARFAGNPLKRLKRTTPQGPAGSARARAQQPAPQTPPDASTAGEVGATIRTGVQTVRAVRVARQAIKDATQAARRARGAPPMSLADTLNTVLGIGAQAYGAYTNVQVAKAQAKAASALARAGGMVMQPQTGGFDPYMTGVQQALYTEPGLTAAGIPPAVLSAIQRFLTQGGGAALGAGLGAGAAMLTAPSGGGGGGAMILRPGDSVDSLYATRATSAAPSFFATQAADGRLRWYRSAGRPILWSGDLAAARRVSKVAARASRGRGRPRSLRRRR